jgi:hypothetical protein
MLNMGKNAYELNGNRCETLAGNVKDDGEI